MALLVALDELLDYANHSRLNLNDCRNRLIDDVDCFSEVSKQINDFHH